MAKSAFIGTGELAKFLGVSRVTVFNRIKSGEIKAQKAGRNFVVQRAALPEILRTTVGAREKNEIKKVVKRVVREYGETLRLLGKD